MILENIANFKKTDDKKKELLRNTLKYGSTAYIVQQTLRSGIPRLLGVRLESHSTNKKNARDILNNGGYLDPSKSGTGSMSIMEKIGDPNVYKRSKNKAYITGIHKDNIGQTTYIHTPFGVKKYRAKEDTDLEDIYKRQMQRKGYRAQSSINYDEANRVYNNTKGDKTMKDAAYRKNIQMQNIKNGLADPFVGRSLYIGGSDNYFNNNFKPDIDDIKAMYSDKPIKVHGNRIGATLDAIKREGLGNLIKSNPSRVAAGAGILGLGGLLVKETLNPTYIKINIGKNRPYNKKNNNYWLNLKNNR